MCHEVRSLCVRTHLLTEQVHSFFLRSLEEVSVLGHDFEPSIDRSKISGREPVGFRGRQITPWIPGPLPSGRGRAGSVRTRSDLETVVAVGGRWPAFSPELVFLWPQLRSVPMSFSRYVFDPEGPGGLLGDWYIQSFCSMSGDGEAGWTIGRGRFAHSTAEPSGASSSARGQWGPSVHEIYASLRLPNPARVRCSAFSSSSSAIVPRSLASIDEILLSVGVVGMEPEWFDGAVEVSGYRSG